MKKHILIAASLFFISIQANAVVISLEGEQADGAEFNIFDLTNTNADEVLDINFNFIYEALTPSWGAELVLELGHIDSETFFQFGTQDFGCADLGVLCDVNLNWLDESGIFSASGVISLAADTILDGSGNWEVLIADTFDDTGADGVFLAGSFIEISQGVRVSSPSAILLFVLAGLSLFARKKLL